MPVNKKKKETKSQGGPSLIDFLSSLKLTIFLCIALAMVSIIGTVIQQNKPEMVYQQIYSPGAFQLFRSLGFFDVYHSWWFLFLLLLLSCNLVACSTKRLRRVWNLAFHTDPLLTPEREKTLSLRERLKSPLPLTSLDGPLAETLGRVFASPVRSEKDGTIYLYAERGRLSRLGPYLVHLGVLVVLLGGTVSSITGYRGNMNLAAGESATELHLHGRPSPIALGFEIRCDRFTIDFYDDGSPKEYRTDATITEGGKVVRTEAIRVNHPLKHKGINFYQSSYGALGASSVNLEISGAEAGETRKIDVSSDQAVPLGDDGAMIRLLRYWPDYRMEMPPGSGMERSIGPAARIEVVREGSDPQQAMLFRQFPKVHGVDLGGKHLKLVGAEESYYTGLQVAHDPGVPWVWLGCTIMFLGFIEALFISHRRMWVRIEALEGKGSKIAVAGSAHRNRAAFEKTFARTIEALKGACTAAGPQS